MIVDIVHQYCAQDARCACSGAVLSGVAYILVIDLKQTSHVCLPYLHNSRQPRMPVLDVPCRPWCCTCGFQDKPRTSPRQAQDKSRTSPGQQHQGRKRKFKLRRCMCKRQSTETYSVWAWSCDTELALNRRNRDLVNRMDRPRGRGGGSEEGACVVGTDCHAPFIMTQVLYSTRCRVIIFMSILCRQ